MEEYKKEAMINSLVADYEGYLSDMTEEDLEIILNSGVFTLREAKKLEG